MRIIECKSSEKIGAPIIRSEFGKAYDLKVSSYLIWSLTTPKDTVIFGANELGIDIETFAFDTSMREIVLTRPEALIEHVANKIVFVKDSSRMLEKINSTAQKINSKLLLSKAK